MNTSGANQQAKALMAGCTKSAVTAPRLLVSILLSCIAVVFIGNGKKNQAHRYLPIIEQQGERAFRIQLIQDILVDSGINSVSVDYAASLLDQFDEDRLKAFNFYSGIVEFLAEARKLFTLVVITNGPEFSQVPKVKAVNLSAHVDHILIGGQEPEEKAVTLYF